MGVASSDAINLRVLLQQPVEVRFVSALIYELNVSTQHYP